MKKAIILIWCTLIACVFSCTDGKNVTGLPYEYLGADATTITKITSPEQLTADIKANELVSNTSDPILAFISTSEILSNWKTQNPFYFSAKGEAGNASIIFAKAKDTLSFTADSIPNAIISKNSINGRLLQKVVLNKDSLFIAEKDSVTIFSTSRKSLLAILDQKEHRVNEHLAKLLQLPQDGELVKTGITSLYSNNVSEVKNMQTSQAVQLLPDGIQVSGIVKSMDSSLIDVFKGQKPQTSKVAAMLPADFKTANGFTFSDAGLLVKNLKKHKQDSTVTTAHPLLETLTEITEAQLASGSALFMTSIDMQQSLASIDIDIKEVETFRDITIYEHTLSGLLTTSFDPLLSNADHSYLVLLDSYMVCTSSPETAKAIISDFQNKKVLEKTAYYGLINTQMLSTSSLYYLGQGAAVSKMTQVVLNTTAPEKTNSKYPLAVLQYSYDSTFAHLNFVTKEVSKQKQVAGTVSQKFSVSLDEPVLGNPQFFTNHRTNGKDVIFQDVTNTLHSYSGTGKKQWSKKLDGAILGEINEIDLLRNGKKQIAFATKNTFYVLDRNGKEVAPFPLNFKDDITQPLSVFDYDNNRKYRFIITQDNAVYMYDSKGKSVKGFTFKKSKTPLVFKPEHIRLSNKDFIVLAEESGKATFLSRTGKERIKVSKTFNFGEIPIQKEGSNFVIISEEGEKHTITSAGSLSSQKLTISDAFHFKTLGNTRVSLDDNVLRINGNLVELPFGIYSAPHLINHNNNTYVSVTDMQEHKVYVYDKNRKLVDGFPVFGTTESRLASSGKNLVLVTTGSDKEVLYYQVN